MEGLTVQYSTRADRCINYPSIGSGNTDVDSTRQDVTLSATSRCDAEYTGYGVVALARLDHGLDLGIETDLTPSNLPPHAKIPRAPPRAPFPLTRQLPICNRPGPVAPTLARRALGSPRLAPVVQTRLPPTPHEPFLLW